jgi:DNA-binding CsgD family transcriptional regulator
MTLLIFITADAAHTLDSDLPLAELIVTIQAGHWQPPDALLLNPTPLRVMRLGRTVLVWPVTLCDEALTDSFSHLRLSERQSQVLQAIADGLTNPQIAVRLGVGRSRVDQYVSALKHRFDTHDRVQLVFRGLALGLCKMKRS